MPKIYKLTKSIHNEIERINQKLELNIEIESYFFWETEDNTIFIPKDIQDGNGYICPVIEAPQIRQILIRLKEVLGINPEYNEITEASWSLKLDEIYVAGYHSAQPRTYAEALCNKWLGGLNPLFDREPETVLTELLEILKTL